MKLFTEYDARQRLCPWMFEMVQTCACKGCMAWVEVYPKVERENHSGAKEMMLREGILKRGGQQIRFEGPDNSSGYIILDALGFCGRNHYLNENK